MNAGQRAEVHTQEKAAHRQKVSYEQCPGYTDRFGIWNNGFNCPRWGGQDEIYCCGDASERFCCPPPTQDVATLFDSSDAGNAPTPSTIRFPVVFMVVTGAGLFLLILGITFIILCCCLCRCCPGYRGRKFRSKATPRNGRAEFVNMEAAETSAAIEAQALSPPGISSVLSSCSVQASPHLTGRRHWTPNGNDCCTASTYRIKRHQTGSSTDDDDLHSVSTICVDLQVTPRSPRGYDDRDQIRKSTNLDYHVISADGKDRSIDSSSSPRLCLETFRPLSRCSEANTTPSSIGCRHSNRKKAPNLHYQQQHHHHHRHPQHNFDLIESIND